MNATIETSQTYGRTAVKTTIAGSGIEAAGGAAAVVLAILGLVNIAPEDMLPIAAIVVGAALLAQAGLLAAGASAIVSRENMGRREQAEFEGGVGAEALAGGAAVVLGILSLLGIEAGVLMSVAAIVLGAGLVLESGAMSRLNMLDDPRDARMTARIAARRAVVGSESAQVLVGIAAVVLGILALIGFDPMVLNLVAMLAVGVSIVLSGAALGGKMASLLSTGR